MAGFGRRRFEAASVGGLFRYRLPDCLCALADEIIESSDPMPKPIK
jgi:hypothetical protein